MQRQNDMQLREQTRMPVRQRCNYCGSIHPPRQCPAYVKMCAVCRKINHFKEVCRSSRKKKLHRINPHQDEDDVDNMNINSININSITFNSRPSVIAANLNTSSSQATSVVPYKVDSGSNGNIMPFHIFK